MSLLEESIKLLWKILEEGKANKEHITNQQNEFLKTATKAVRQTLSYIRDENKRDKKTEEELSELWADVALAARPFDSDLAERCYIKSNYWANPDKWSKEEVEKAGIEIERIGTEIRNHFKGKARAKKSKQQKAIEKTELGNKEPGRKFSWKKIWAIVISSILVLAALTTLILNLDKIKNKIRGEAEKQIPPSKNVQPTMNESPGGVQVAGDLYINGTENPLHKPILAASASVEVRIKSDWDFNGLVANMKAYLAFGKEDKSLLKASSIGYIASQTGKGEVIYKGDLVMEANDSAVGNPVSFLRDTEYIQIVLGGMPPDSNILGGNIICTINNSVRLESAIPPQKLANNKIFIRNLSKFLQVLNEPDM